ncbi:uncharacterized protein PHACADRAFT_203037 [Phanerochaete carnosa HHB-10118-sp]|uniref:Uncharacterized protein n=1 Tax=Phanerochaete carnosa (strain HHB-10118-sp) TaxID=650164 RepID=K5WDK7_PHACS|nr:uncharacterized protein PHACADRAFT_203037 [Phanerochaete carnosa HHB-10118-sp]EKM48257.1 hypothetical protein PHACADRAFT_203037 [Phanerochaete carnosa HHB-10118-sp]
MSGNQKNSGQRNTNRTIGWYQSFAQYRARVRWEAVKRLMETEAKRATSNDWRVLFLDPSWYSAQPLQRERILKEVAKSIVGQRARANGTRRIIVT